MKLLVDIGNTRVKWTTLDKEGLGESQSFIRGKTGIKASLNKAWKSLDNISHVFVANVAGDKMATQLSEWTEKNWNLSPVFISSEKKRFGVINAYQQPEKLGVDRWLALIAARQHARQAQCIIDCGTAITVDIVTRTGQHQGGMILPGLGLMRSSLQENTAALTEQLDNKEFKTLATNTASAIQTGTLYAASATIERIINDLNDSFDNRIRFIITGGDAETLLPVLSDQLSHYPDIVLKGLAFYARQEDRQANRRHNKTEQKTRNEQSADSDEAPQNETSSDISDKEQQPQTTTSEKNDDEQAVAKKPKPRRSKATKQVKSEAEKPQNPDPTLPEETI